MSQYFQVEGSVTYPSKAALYAAIKALRDNGWMQGDNFVGEDGEIVNNGPDDDVDFGKTTLNIPHATYRNLGRFNFFASQGVPVGGEGTVVLTSTDGCFEGSVIVNGEMVVQVDLEEWAAENLEGDDAKPPALSDYADKDEYNENLCKWQSFVCEKFFERHKV